MKLADVFAEPKKRMSLAEVFSEPPADISPPTSILDADPAALPANNLFLDPPPLPEAPMEWERIKARRIQELVEGPQQIDLEPFRFAYENETDPDLKRQHLIDLQTTERLNRARAQRIEADREEMAALQLSPEQYYQKQHYDAQNEFDPSNPLPTAMNRIGNIGVGRGVMSGLTGLASVPLEMAARAIPNFIPGGEAASQFADQLARTRADDESYNQYADEQQGAPSKYARQITEMFTKYIPAASLTGGSGMLGFIFGESQSSGYVEGQEVGLEGPALDLYANSLGAINTAFTYLGGKVAGKLGTATAEEIAKNQVLKGTGIPQKIARGIGHRIPKAKPLAYKLAKRSPAATPDPLASTGLKDFLKKYAIGAAVETGVEEIPTYFAENLARYTAGIQEDAVPGTWAQDIMDIAVVSGLAQSAGSLSHMQGPLVREYLENPNEKTAKAAGIPQEVVRNKEDAERIAAEVLGLIEPENVLEPIQNEAALENVSVPIQNEPAQDSVAPPGTPSDAVSFPASEGPGVQGEPIPDQEQTPPAPAPQSPAAPSVQAPEPVREQAPRAPETKQERLRREQKEKDNARRIRQGIGISPSQGEAWLKDAITRRPEGVNTPQEIADWIERGFTNEHYWKLLKRDGLTLPEAIAREMQPTDQTADTSQQVAATPAKSTRPLWRETSADDALEFLGSGKYLRGGYSFGPPDIFLADNPDLAIGQGSNQGVVVEFEGEGLKLKENVKPGTQVPGVGKEYITQEYPEKMSDAVRSVTIKPGKHRKPSLAALRRALKLEGFTPTAQEDGSEAWRPSGTELPSPTPGTTGSMPGVSNDLTGANGEISALAEVNLDAIPDAQVRQQVADLDANIDLYKKLIACLES